jgi:hypothetical protein
MLRDVEVVLSVLAALAAYLGVPLFFLSRGWPLRAGVGMLFAAFLPLVWPFSTEDDPPLGSGFLTGIMLPLPLLLIAIGLVTAVFRLAGKARKRGLAKITDTSSSA